MQPKYILLIDMDGVICDWYGRLVSLYRERYPNRPYIEPSKVSQFYCENLYPEEHREDLVAITREIGFYRDLEPIPGAIEALEDMMHECIGFIEPFICSSPEVMYTGLQCHSEKANWIEQHLGPWWTRRLILTEDKTLVRGHFLIDDKPEVTGVMTPTWAHLRYEQPYNAQYKDQRFGWVDWPDLRAFLKNHIEQQASKLERRDAA